MENNEPKFDRVVGYIRKSSEDNEQGGATKQLNSLDYQRHFVTQEAPVKYDLKPPIKVFEDDKSGYEAYIRDGFEEMLHYLEDRKNEVDGIVCTEISRLARNFGDGGKILWFLQNGTIKRIYTPSKIFTNSSSDQMMVAIELAMSKKSSDETGERTIAGMKSKAFVVRHPPRDRILGYLSEGRTGQKRWLIDPIKGPLVKEIFEQFATGKYTQKQIAEYAFNRGLVSSDKKSKTGVISKNTWSTRLKDIKYTGIFYYKDSRIVGDYEALISPELFYAVQEVFSENTHHVETHLDYAYSGLIKCGYCSDMLSGTNKKGHTYYRCGKRKSPCKENGMPYAREETLENSLIEALESIEIDQETWQACREYVSEISQPEKLKVKKQIRELNDKISAEERMQIDIDRKYAQNDITKPERDRLMKDSYLKIASLKNTVIKCENLSHEIDELMYHFLDNVKYVTKRLRIALPDNKRELISIFCENLVWQDKKLRWDWKNPYFLLTNQTKSSTVLKTWDSYRSVDWVNEIEYPELTYQETQKFLSAKFLSN